MINVNIQMTGTSTFYRPPSNNYNSKLNPGNTYFILLVVSLKLVNMGFT